MTNKMEELYDWLFHYSPYTKAWHAFKRDHVSEYFNGNHKNVIKSKSQKTLEELIVFYNGDIQKMNEVIALNI